MGQFLTPWLETGFLRVERERERERNLGLERGAFISRDRGASRSEEHLVEQRHLICQVCLSMEKLHRIDFKLWFSPNFFKKKFSAQSY